MSPDPTVVAWLREVETTGFNIWTSPLSGDLEGEAARSVAASAHKALAVLVGDDK